MTIQVFASTDNDPQANPGVPAEHVAADLPVASVQLYAAAVDSEDVTPAWEWSWTLLQKPPGSSASLSAVDTQSPTLNTVDTVGDYRLMVSVVNTNHDPDEGSEPDPLLAPTVAFVEVWVTTANRALRKPAPGARDWWLAYWDMVDKFDAFTGGVGAHAIADHTDVEAATGPSLDAMVGGGYAEYPSGSPGTRLHKHRGADVDQAGTGARGTVVLSDAPLNFLDPKVFNRNYYTFTAHVSHIIATAVDSNPGTLGIGVSQHGTANVANLLAVWRVPRTSRVESWSVFVVDGGSAAQVDPPIFRLGYTDTDELAVTVPSSSGWTSLVAGEDAGGLSGVPANDHDPLTLYADVQSTPQVGAGTYLAVWVDGTPDYPYLHVTFTVNLHVRI